MNGFYDGGMAKTNLQVRDVDVEQIEVLKARAAEQGISLSAYVRGLIAEEAARPSIAEVMGRIAGRTSIDVSVEDVRSMMDEERR